MTDRNDNPKMPLRTAVWYCGWDVARALFWVAIAILVVGWTFENDMLARSWAWLLWAGTGGGQSIWFAICGAIAAIGFFIWGQSVHRKSDGGLSFATRVWGSMVCFTAWFVFYSAALEAVDGISSFAICGLVVASLPILRIFGGLLQLLAAPGWTDR